MGIQRKRYISKRLVEQKSNSAFREAAKKAMELNGYVVIAHEGWLVKKYSDGRIEKLERLQNDRRSLEVILD